MQAESNPDTTNIEVITSTNETTANVQEEPNVFQRSENHGGAGGAGERFGRGGRFGGSRGGGSGSNQRGGRNFEQRRGGSRGGFRGGRNVKPEGDGGEGGYGFDNRDDHERGGMRGPRGGGMRGPEDKFLERLNHIGGPTYDLPPLVLTEKKFNGRNRLYIGNIGSEVTEEELVELFKPYGEIAEVFINKDKNFGFVKVDYHCNAEKAKTELDGTVVKSRNLKIRFAPNSASVKVRNLTQYVSNELLHYAFSIFGEIERAIVNVDERGKSTGEAIIDYARKGSALHAIRRCSEGCFFLTGSLQPVIVESFDIVDDIDGYPEKNINKKNPEYSSERERGPRFAAPGSFENEYGIRWKQLYDLHAQKEEALKKEFDLEKEKLIAQMEYAKFEHETEMLRNQLRAREMDKDRQKREWEMKQRQVEEERMRTEELRRRSQEHLESRLSVQDELRRKQQENTLFMQAHNLNSILDQQEHAYDTPIEYNKDTEDDNVAVDPKSFMSSYERHGGGNRFDRDMTRQENSNRGGGGGHWVNDSRRADDLPNKRRRY